MSGNKFRKIYKFTKLQKCHAGVSPHIQGDTGCRGYAAFRQWHISHYRSSEGVVANIATRTKMDHSYFVKMSYRKIGQGVALVCVG